MKARQNSDESTRAYVRDAKMVPPEKPVDKWHHLRLLGELALMLLFLISALLICLTIMQG